MVSHGLDQYLKKKKVAEILGLSISSIDRMVKQKRFPQPVKISTNRIAFRLAELVAWQCDPKGWAHRAAA